MSDDKVENKVHPSKNKRIGKICADNCIAVSNPYYGNLRIIGTENNRMNDCRIVVCMISLMIYNIFIIVFDHY